MSRRSLDFKPMNNTTATNDGAATAAGTNHHTLASVEAIQQAPVHGDAYRDGPLLAELHRIIMGQYDEPALARAAYRKIGDVMGLPGEPADDEEADYGIEQYRADHDQPAGVR